MSGLLDSKVVKVMKCTWTKYILDKLQNICEGRSIEERSSYFSRCESKTEEAQFVRKLNKGPRKYKVNLPFKWFNCGRKGHVFDKWPYA